ncbi:hypothetical protein WN990_18690 [Kitasatospora purpeofusca]|uniref:hypothetical protein n=1 Tax=Kitasatospora purpeofusca TaxID=67352 RepID=UPI0030F27418
MSQDFYPPSPDLKTFLEHETQADRDWNDGHNWAGLLPIRQVYGPAEPDSTAAQRGSAVPCSVQDLIGRNGAG